jgi:hypothetical protein
VSWAAESDATFAGTAAMRLRAVVRTGVRCGGATCRVARHQTSYCVTVRFTVSVAVGGLAPAALTLTTAE